MMKMMMMRRIMKKRATRRTNKNRRGEEGWGRMRIKGKRKVKIDNRSALRGLQTIWETLFTWEN